MSFCHLLLGRPLDFFSLLDFLVLEVAIDGSSSFTVSNLSFYSDRSGYFFSTLRSNLSGFVFEFPSVKLTFCLFLLLL